MIPAGAALIITGICLAITGQPAYSASRDPGAWLLTAGIVLVLVGWWQAAWGV